MQGLPPERAFWYHRGMAVSKNIAPVSRPTYTERLNVKDVRQHVRSALKNQYGHAMSKKQLKTFFGEHPEFGSSGHQKVIFGVMTGKGKTIERYRVKNFLDTLGKAVRKSQQEEVQQKVRFSVQGRRGFREPKTTMKKLAQMRITSVTPEGPTKAELRQQEKLETRRRNIQQYERNKELREEINKRLFGQTSARSSVFEGREATDFHKGAKTSATDYKSIPVSIADIAAKRQEPLGSAAERSEKPTEFHPQQRAVSDSDTEKDSSDEGDSVDDDLPLAA